MRTKTMISIQEVMDNAEIQDNVEPKKLRSAMIVVQDKKLGDLLGSALLDFLYDKRTDAGTWTGLTTDQNTLVVDYLEPYLLWATQTEFLQNSTFLLTNIGNVKPKSDINDVATKNDIENRFNLWSVNTDHYASRMQTWLDHQFNAGNQDEIFTLYNSANQNQSPSGQVLDPVIYIPSRRRRYNGCEGDNNYA